jgi:folylpolyglutamate synthase/dihydropteroate synthase
VKNRFQSLPFKCNLHRYTGEAARVAAAIATPAFMSDLQDFGIVTTPEEAAGFRAFVVESEEAPEDIRVARGAAAAAAAAVEALQDYVAAAKEAAALNLEGTTGTTPGEASNRASATYSATESPAAAAAAAVAAADASHVAEDYVGALVEACAAVEPAGRLERCYPQFVTRCTELIAEQRRWAKVGL